MKRRTLALAEQISDALDALNIACNPTEHRRALREVKRVSERLQGLVEANEKFLAQFPTK